MSKKHFIFAFLIAGFVLLVPLAAGNQAFAQVVFNNANTNLAGKMAPGGLCVNYIGGAPVNGVMIERLVNCLTAVPDGIIPRLVNTFITGVQAYAMAINTSMILLAVVLFGLRTMLVADMNSIKRDGIILLFKIGAVTMVIQNGAFYYQQVLGMTQGFIDIMTQAIFIPGPQSPIGMCSDAIISQVEIAGSMVNTGKSVGAAVGTPGGPSAWTLLDCILGRIIGFGGVLSLKDGLLLLFAGALFAGPLGWIVFFTGLGIVLKLAFLVARVVHIFLMAALGLAFMFCVGFIFIPLIFFKESQAYFMKWLRLCIGYVLIPFMTYAYIAFCVVALNVTFFNGTYSVMQMIGGAPAVAAPAAASDSVGSQMQSTFTNGSLWNMTVNGNPQNAPTGTAQQQGAAGQVRQATGTPSQGTGNSDISVGVFKSDFNAMAAKKGVASVITYLKDLILSLCVALLTVYLLYNGAKDVPTTITDIAIQGFNAGSIAQDKAIGEVTTMLTVQMSRDMVIAAAKGMSQGGPKAAMLQAAMVANRYRGEMMRRAPGDLRG